MRNYLLAAAGLAFAAAATGGYAAGSPEAGKQKSAMCAGCHGIEGYRTAYPEVYPVPRIGGQHPEYIVSALEAYKSGARKHPSMTAIAGSLSQQDMADLAAYYGQGGAK